MNRFSLCASLLLLSSPALGCGSNIVASHTLEVTLERDGVTTHATLAFPAHDPDAHHSPGDSSCDFHSGNCGSNTPTKAHVTGSAPIVGAFMTTSADGTSITYDVDLAPTPEDEAAAKGSPTPWMFRPTCRVYESELGVRQPCYYGTHPAFVTLRRR